MIKFFLPHKKQGEKLILLIRRHPFVLLKILFIWVLVAITPVAIFFILSDYISLLLKNEVAYALGILFLSIFYLYIWLFSLNAFVDYYLDVWIVTNERIISSEQKQLFSRVISEHDLSKIQDVTAEIHGLLPTFLNFGEVHIQTAAEKQRFIFKQVPSPQDIKRKITELCEYKKRYLRIMEDKERNM